VAWQFPRPQSDRKLVGNYKKRLQRYDCTTKSKLKEWIIQIWYHDEELQNLCSNLVNSMPTRVAMLINAKGGHIIIKTIENVVFTVQK